MKILNNQRVMGLLIVAFCAALLVLAALAGCKPSAVPAGDSNNQESNSVLELRNVTDVYGRTVELPKDVQTAATVGSAARFVVYAGAQDKLIAVTQLDVDASPSRPYTVAQKSVFASLPVTSNGNHLMETSVDTEAMLSLRPDVIISSRSAAECDELQNAIGIPVVGISYQDQLFSQDVYDSILVVGQALGTQEHAQSVVEAMQGWEADLKARTSSINSAQRPSCYAGAVNYKGAKSFGGTYAQYAPFQAVNALNVADSLNQKAAIDIDLEQLGAWNPDFIFLNMSNRDLLIEDYKNNTAFFDGLSAFKNGKVFSQPIFNHNGTNVEMGICNAYFVGAMIYPELFDDMDLAKQYDKVFSTMLGVPYYETMKANGADFTQVSFAQ